MTLGVGDVFAGYTVIDRLGGGSFGEVFLVRHPRLPREDALKVLRSEIGNDDAFRRRFVREAFSAGKLSHPNIIAVFDHGEVDGRLWIATQYVPGADASALLSKRYPAGMPATEAVPIIAAVGDALDYAHRSGLVHRDVKPSNILLGDDRRVFLADFGIVLPLGEASDLTATNAVFGTYAYAAPEQLDGNDLDGRADQYALAASAFHLLTGERPFPGENAVAVLRSRHNRELPRLAAIRPDLAAVDSVLAKAMAIDPAERYPSCTAFAWDLAHYAHRSSVQTSGPTMPRYAASSPVHPDGTILFEHAERESSARPQQSATETRLAPQPDSARRIAASYATRGQAVELGSVVVGGLADPSAQILIPLAMMDRHGLVAGAAGAGKTKTLQMLAEQFSIAGVPVLMADYRGDLSGLSRPGKSNAQIIHRAKDTGDEWGSASFPVEFLSLGSWGVGIPVRGTVSSFGPILLARMLGLNRNEASSLSLIFHYSDQQGLPLIDLKDLRSVITFLISAGDGELQLQTVGSVPSQDASAILLALNDLESHGGDSFFGEPEFEPTDLIRVDYLGRGIISLLELGEHSAHQSVCSTFLVWLLADLLHALPDVGDTDKPRFALLLDEAHLLFRDSSPVFLELLEQMIRLCRSKGVAVFFCTQRPTDIPDNVLSLVGTRIQHALRSISTDDRKALAEAVHSYPESDTYDLLTDLTRLEIGEAFVTSLSEGGVPTPAAWTRVRAPRSLMTSIGPDSMKAAARSSPLFLKYGPTADRESAYEMLTRKTAPSSTDGSGALECDHLPPLPNSQEKAEPGILELMMDNPAFKSAMRSAGTEVGREITRSIFGTARRRRR
jgi:serine/threonine protein kinase/DNA helicase HerA-like ATPase